MKHKARSYSDTAPVTPEVKRRGGDKLADPGATISVPRMGPVDRARARRGLIRRDGAALLRMLGLGAAGDMEGYDTEACSDCGAQAGQRCTFEGGERAPHRARLVLAEKGATP